MENNMRKTVNTLEKEADSAREKVSDSAQDIFDTGRETWKDLSNRSRTMWRQTRDQSGEAIREAQDMVRKYPARAVGVALLAGALFGLLIATRSED